MVQNKEDISVNYRIYKKLCELHPNNRKEALKRFKMYCLKYEYAELTNQKTNY